MNELDEQGDAALAKARVGTTIGGGWRLDALLGVGGTAAVYAATHPSGNRLAFKVLHARRADDADMVRRFYRELDVVARIKHPACVRVLGSGRADDGSPILAMELLEGRSLHSVWARRRGPFPLGEALRIVDVLLDFLGACHAAQIVHRDLTLSNVFLTSDRAVRVLDFGLARSGSRKTTGRRALGTPAFMPPEQARGEPLDARADLFSIGAILFTLLTGRELRTGTDSGALFGAAQREAPMAFSLVAPDAPRAVAHLIDRALAWSPRDRWPNARAMRNEVTRLRASLGDVLFVPVEILAREEQGDEETRERITSPGTPYSLSRIVTSILRR